MSKSSSPERPAIETVNGGKQLELRNTQNMQKKNEKFMGLRLVHCGGKCLR
jgi:hypothetical protein